MEVDAKTIQQTIIDVARVTGLELFGQGNDTNFTGRDAHFVWRMTSSAGIIELGDEPTGGESTYMDQTFLCWKIAIYSEYIIPISEYIIFFDDFTSTNTIDMANSSNAGFNWYREQWWGNGTTNLERH